MHHLAFEVPDEPGPGQRTDVAGLDHSDSPVRVIEPQENLGTRLVLVTADGGRHA
jgi:hypothetical protein